MSAVVLTGHGELDKLVYRTDWPIPEISDSEVLIKVHACGLNNTDVNTRTAWYSKGTDGGGFDDAIKSANNKDAGWGGTAITFPRIQGADVCGTVVAIGAHTNPNLIGKRVLIDCVLRDWDAPEVKDGVGYYGSECDGGFAHYTKIDYRNVHPISSTLSNAELATFSTSWTTAEGMLNRAGVKTGDSVFITGASGGVGSALIALANRRGAKTIAMTSLSKREAVASLGPDEIFIRGHDSFKDISVSVVADVVAGNLFSDLINTLKRGGRYVTSGAIGGAMVALDIRTLYLHDLTLLGSTVVPDGTFADIVSYIEREEIKPILAKTFPLKHLHEAQKAFIAKQHVGNIVVTLED